MKKVLFATAALIAVPTIAFADETVKLTGNLRVVASQTQQFGDADGHAMSLLRGEGTAQSPEGAAQISFISTTDYIHGNGQFLVYMEAAFNDGSALYFKGPGTAVVKGQTVDLRVPITIIGGKGKYAGAKGDGQLIGTRMQPLPGQGAQISNELTLKISCPTPACSR